MDHPTDLSQRLHRRFLPLYVAAFLQSCVFWYSTEKLFMLSIGFTAATIGVMAAAYSVVMLAIETPSGLLADRWSRRGILIIAGLMLALSSLIEGLSHTVGTYIIGAIFWGIFYALYSGTYDPIVYDTLLEDTGSTDDFKRYYGIVKFLDGFGLIVGSVAGALIASDFGLRAMFFYSVPLAVISSLVLLGFREPNLHRAKAAVPIVQHIRSTFEAALTRGALLSMLLILVTGTVLSELIFEYFQLWLVATHTPVGLFGIYGGFLLGTVAIAGLAARRLQLESRNFVVILTTILMICAIIITTIQVAWVLFLALSIISIGLLSTGIVYLERFHDRLPSNVRSGASSAVSTIGRVLFIIMVIVFGRLTSAFSVFAASWIIVAALALISVFLIIESSPDAARG